MVNNFLCRGRNVPWSKIVPTLYCYARDSKTSQCTISPKSIFWTSISYACSLQSHCYWNHYREAYYTRLPSAVVLAAIALITNGQTQLLLAAEGYRYWWKCNSGDCSTNTPHQLVKASNCWPEGRYRLSGYPKVQPRLGWCSATARWGWRYSFL